jgi:ABC-type lipoprotein release transport system permease subunit
METLRWSWRNLWRNTARTAITLAGAAFSTAILIATFALMDGLMVHAVSNITNLSLGEVQAHAPGYLTDRSLYKSLPDPDALLAAAERQGVAAAARRLGDGLIAFENQSAGALFWGVDPARERAAFTLAAHVAEGRFLADAPGGEVVLGRQLARSLGVTVGAEVVVVVQAADGSLGNDLFTVAGILQSADDEIDRGGALIHQDDFVRLFVSGDRVHEVAFNSRGRMPIEALQQILQRAAPGADVQTWRGLRPTFADMVTLMDGFIWVFGLIFGLAAGLGVTNTMLMATHERVREFGLVKALGGTPGRIVRDVTVEASLLAAAGIALGVALGVLGALYLQRHGIDTSRWAGGFSVGGVAFDPVWRAALTARGVFVPVVVMFVAAILPSLYPAGVAARLDPVHAMNRV